MNRPILSAAVVVLVIAMLAPEVAGSSEHTPLLHRGINTFPWLHRARTLDNDSKTFDFDHPFPYLNAYRPEHFDRLRKAGADFIRVPVEVGPFAAADGRVRAALIATLMDQLRKITDQGLTAILDPHPREGGPAWSTNTILSATDTEQRYQGMLLDFSRAIEQLGDQKIVLELMNEPPGGYSWHDKVDWRPFQSQLVKAIRAVAPQLPLILTGDRGGGIDGLLRLDPTTLDDGDIIYSFHYYDPMIVTHQGATWTSEAWRQYVSGIAYPASPDDLKPSLKRVHDAIFSDNISDASKESLWSHAQVALRDYYASHFGIENIRADFERVSQWAAEHKIPKRRILLGEFGIYRPGASHETDVNYTHDVRTVAEEAGFAWSYWNYTPNDDSKQSFSILRMQDPGRNEFDPDITVRGLGWHMP